VNITHRAAKPCFVVLTILAALAGGHAHGYNVAFNGIGGVNSDPYVGHSEGGFTVSPIAGTWLKGHSFGNPVPSIFGVPPTPALVRVTDTTTGLFTFSSVDLAGLTNSSATYSVEGFRNNSSVLVTSGTLSIANVFFNIPSPDSLAVLDRLDISISPNSASSFNVDNVVLNHVVPEPATFGLLAIGAVAALVVRRSR
jgi:hypothetical protein